MSTADEASRIDLAGAFAEVVGAEQLVTDPARLMRLSGDLSMEAFETAALAVRPGTVEELIAVARRANELRNPIVLRGAGMSYTRAHTPLRPGLVLVDTTRLDRVDEINVEDLTVTVEAGVTWERLYLALLEEGVRTPFWGPLSGRNATVGGTLSQNSVFFGSARYGTAADSVLGLQVVLADGTLVTTGSGAHRAGTPFFRHFGPDLTGLFLCDSGAMGLKARATLELIPMPAVSRGASFTFGSRAAANTAMAAMARLRVASDLYGFDGFYHGLLAELGVQGLRGHAASLHTVVEGADDAQVAVGLSQLRAQATRYGEEIPGDVPLLMRADPFGATQMMFRAAPAGVHLPLHAVVPFSRASTIADVLDRFLLDRATELAAHGIGTWELVTATGRDLNFEVTLHFGADYRDPTVAPAARAAGVALRRELADRFTRSGAVHTQLGKYYGFRDELRPATWELLEAIKDAVDPDGQLNPGALGLGVR